MRLRRTVVLACAVAALAAPAARAAAGPGAGRVSPVEQRWLLSVEQLAANVAAAGRAGSVTGGSVESARALLASTQVLFESAVAYGVCSSCSQTLSEAGRFILASDLFVSAIHSKQLQALVAAEVQAATGVSLMERAAAGLAAFRKAQP